MLLAAYSVPIFLLLVPESPYVESPPIYIQSPHA